MASTRLPTPKPRGPAADPRWPSSLAPGNPYNFTPALLQAARLPVKITDKYIFFFGYEDDEPEVCLQQWFPAPFAGPKHNFTESRNGNGETVDFATSEHFMMYHKALLMNDTEIAQRILDAEHPSDTKRLGREVKNFNPDVWAKYADEVVEMGNWYKFSDRRNEDLKHVLLGTGERELVEASPDDRIWGIGFNSEDGEEREGEWGANRLGKALVRVRNRLRG